MAMLIVFRFCLNFVFVIYCLYVPELFPSKVKAMAVSLSIFGWIASTINPLLLGYFSREGINPMIYFTALGLVGLVAFSFLTETKGLRMEEEI